MKKAMLLAVAALIAAACTFKEEEVQELDQTLHPTVRAIVAEQAGDAEETKTYYDNTSSPEIKWKKGDEISVFASAVNERYAFSGEDGDIPALFSHVSGRTGMQTYSTAYAVYPYSETNAITDEGLVVSFPANQTYSENSFGSGVAPMVALCPAGEDLEFHFLPVCGYIRVPLWNADGAKVKSITLTAEDSKISGKASVYYSTSVAPEVTMDSEAGNSVTLDCGEGVALGTSSESPTVFWIALPPVNMAKGFNMKVTTVEGAVFQKSTTKSRTIARNIFNTMGAVECEFIVPLKLKYSATAGTEVKIAYNLEKYPVAGSSNPLLSIDYGDGQTGTSATHTYSETGEYEVSMFFDGPVKEIGNSAFFTCEALVGIELPSSLEKIGEMPFYGCSLCGDFVVPGNVELMERAFSGCGSFDSFTIPADVVLNGDYQFEVLKAKKVYMNCNLPDHKPDWSRFLGAKVDVFTIGKDVTTIGDWAFYTNHIKSFVFESPSSVTRIGDAAFAESRELQVLDLPSSVTSISELYTFDLCKKLEAINIRNSKYFSENGILYTYTDGLLTVVRYPEGKQGESYESGNVGVICSSAFNGNPYLKSISLHLMRSIPFRAFYDCKNLSEISGCDYQYQSGSKTIGEEAFEGCESLTEYTIPALVDTVKKSAFRSATNLKRVYCPTTTPPVLVDEENYDGSFCTFGNNAVNRKIYVPVEAVEAYKAADGWKNYKDDILGYDYDNNSISLSSRGTANCYVVSDSGRYSFDPVKGNSSTSVGDVDAVNVVWESFGTDVAPAVGDLVNEVSYSDGKIYFTATDKKGNALIAAKDSEGNILWSWHIWMTDKPVDQVYCNDAGTMMDRNLGATSATPGDVKALGLLYQWGRKDPFMGGSSISSSQRAKATDNWPAAVSSTANYGREFYANAHPTTFIMYNKSNYDWNYLGATSPDNTRWQTSDKSKGIYDPCPAGYRVPDGGPNGVWAVAFGSESTVSVTFHDANKGVDLGAENGDGIAISTSKVTWYPLAGGISYYDATLGGVGTGAFYWSCSPDGLYAYGLSIDNNGYCSTNGAKCRAMGGSVRCCKE